MISTSPSADLHNELIATESEASRDFNTLALPESMQKNLRSLGYDEMTPIQAETLPITLSGKDLIAQAKTGSGKTAAFGLPLLLKLKPRYFAIQALIVCPTRELADQVAQEVRRLARFENNIKVLPIYGGRSIHYQIASLERGAHVVVGTPGRLKDLIDRGYLDLNAVNTFVLDEADRMLDMGFYDEIVQISEECPKRRQTLLFSATYPDAISEMAQTFLNDPLEVKLLDLHATNKIRQRFYSITEEDRLTMVGQLLKEYQPTTTLAFCNTKQQCQELLDELHDAGFCALMLTGDMEQRDREQVLIEFSHQSCSVLIATDVAARGLDIPKLEAVINVDITTNPETHIHRIGRTGRVNDEGWALNLCAPKDHNRVKRIEKMSGQTAQWEEFNLDENSGAFLPPMVTLQIAAGKRDKIRPGDVLGALTGDAGFTRDVVGKITVTDFSTYVAISREQSDKALRELGNGKIKGRKFKVRVLL